LKLEPNWSALPASTPHATRQLIERCLAKDRRQRLQAIGEARITIEKVLNGALEVTATSEARPVLSPSRLGKLGWIAAAVFALVALGLGALYLRKPVEEARTIKLFLPPPERSILWGNIPSLSPDGRHIAFVAATDGKDGLLRLTAGELFSMGLSETGDFRCRPSPRDPLSQSVRIFLPGKNFRFELVQRASNCRQKWSFFAV
jgi:hypothetical protein